MDTQCFKGKRIIVTGAGAGIGYAVAKKLYELGATVVAMSRTQWKLDALQKEIPDVELVCLDLSDWQTTRDAVEKVLPIDMVVNNAGIGHTATVLEATPEDFDQLFAIHVKAALNISQVVCRDLIKRGSKGSILNISSKGSIKPLAPHMVYCSAKASLDMMTRCFALEMGSHGIRFNTINPTVVMTDMGIRDWSDPKKAQAITSKMPSGRFAELHEVVSSVVFMLSDSSEIINGHSLTLDGGYTTC